MSSRTLTTEELRTLDASITGRLAGLARVGVTIQGAEFRYITELLHELLSPMGRDAARERYLTWLGEELDKVEPEIRKQRLMGGIGNTNGAY